MMKSLILSLSLILSFGAFAADNASETAAAEMNKTAPTTAELTELEVTAPSTDFVAAQNNSEANTPIVAADEKVAEGSAPKTEADIPVSLDAKVAAKSSDGSLRDLMLAAALLGGLGLFAWLGLAKFRTRNQKVSQFQMKVLAQHHLGPKKSLMVVRVAGESVLLGVTDHNINLLKSLSLLDEDLPEEAPAATFGSVFSKTPFSQQGKADVDENENDEDSNQDAGPSRIKSESSKPSRFSFGKKNEDVNESEDFTISKIRDVVHRQVRNLKNLE